MFRTMLMTYYIENLVIAVNRDLCGYYINSVGCMLSLHSNNETSFCVMVKKASNFVGRFTDKFSKGLCLDFVCSIMAS